MFAELLRDSLADKGYGLLGVGGGGGFAGADCPDWFVGYDEIGIGGYVV